MPNFYYILFKDRSHGGFYFIVYRIEGDTVEFESATHETITEAETIAQDIIREFEHLGK